MSRSDGGRQSWVNCCRSVRVVDGLALCLTEANQRLLIMCPDMGRLLPSLLASEVLTVRQQSLALVLQLAQMENGRSLIISHLDLTR